MALKGGLLVWGLYLLLGLALNRWWPLHSIDDWFRLFLFATPLRLAAWSFLVYWNFRAGAGLPLLGSRLRGRTVAWYAALIVGAWAVLVSASSGEAWSPAQRLLGLLALIPVGLLEEYLFRGVLLKGIGEKTGPRAASLITALMFTLFHTRPQAVAAWPHIFLSGVVFAHLRLRGLSIAQLALIHGAADALFFFAGRSGVREYGLNYQIFLALLAVYAVLTIPKAPAK